ncbi:hypothetical protein GCM10023063_33330 [Arthrobacter methylotrophus]
MNTLGSPLRSPTLTSSLALTYPSRRRSNLFCWLGDGIWAPFARLHLLQAATKFCSDVAPPFDHG